MIELVNCEVPRPAARWTPEYFSLNIKRMPSHSEAAQNQEHAFASDICSQKRLVFQLSGPEENEDVRHNNQRHEERWQETERKLTQRMHRSPVLESKAERRHDDKEDISEADRVPDDEYAPISSTREREEENRQGSDDDITRAGWRGKGVR